MSKRRLKSVSIQINGERPGIAVMRSNEGVFGNEVLCATFCDIGHTSVILYCLPIQIRCSSSRCRVCESALGPEARFLQRRVPVFHCDSGRVLLESTLQDLPGTRLSVKSGFLKSRTAVGVARSGKSEPVVVPVHCYWLQHVRQ